MSHSVASSVSSVEAEVPSMLTAGQVEEKKIATHYSALKAALKNCYRNERPNPSNAELNTLKLYFRGFEYRGSKRSCLPSGAKIGIWERKCIEINKTDNLTLSGLRNILSTLKKELEKNHREGFIIKTQHPLDKFLGNTIATINAELPEVEAEQARELEERTKKLAQREAEIKALELKLNEKVSELDKKSKALSDLSSEKQAFLEHTSNYSTTLREIVGTLNEVMSMSTYKEAQKQSVEMGRQIAGLQGLKNRILSVVAQILSQLTALASALDSAISEANGVGRKVEQVRLHIHDLIKNFDDQEVAAIADRNRGVAKACQEESFALRNSQVEALKKVCEAIQAKYSSYKALVDKQWFKFFRKGRKKLKKLEQIQLKAAEILDELNGDTANMDVSRPNVLYQSLRTKVNTVFATLSADNLSDGRFVGIKLDVEILANSQDAITHIGLNDRVFAVLEKHDADAAQRRGAFYEGLMIAPSLVDDPLQQMVARVAMAREVAENTQKQLQGVLDMAATGQDFAAAEPAQARPIPRHSGYDVASVLSGASLVLPSDAATQITEQQALALMAAHRGRSAACGSAAGVVNPGGSPLSSNPAGIPAH